MRAPLVGAFGGRFWWAPLVVRLCPCALDGAPLVDAPLVPLVMRLWCAFGVGHAPLVMRLCPYASGRPTAHHQRRMSIIKGAPPSIAHRYHRQRRILLEAYSSKARRR